MNTPASLRSELIAIRSESLIDIAGIARDRRHPVSSAGKAEPETLGALFGLVRGARDRAAPGHAGAGRAFYRGVARIGPHPESGPGRPASLLRRPGDAPRPRSYSLQFLILYFFLYWRLTRLDFAATTTSPPPISMMDWTPPPPLACSLTPIHAPTPQEVDPAEPLTPSPCRSRRARRQGGIQARRLFAGNRSPAACGGNR